MKTPLTPYQRIMRAAESGRGVHLSPDEVWAMSQDDAIATVALNDDDPSILEHRALEDKKRLLP